MRRDTLYKAFIAASLLAIFFVIVIPLPAGAKEIYLLVEKVHNRTSITQPELSNMAKIMLISRINKFKGIKAVDLGALVDANMSAAQKQQALNDMGVNYRLEGEVLQYYEERSSIFSFGIKEHAAYLTLGARVLDRRNNEIVWAQARSGFGVDTYARVCGFNWRRKHHPDFFRYLLRRAIDHLVEDLGHSLIQIEGKRESGINDTLIFKGSPR